MGTETSLPKYPLHIKLHSFLIYSLFLTLPILSVTPDNIDIGGKKDKSNDKDKWKKKGKDKENEKELAEEEKPRNGKFMEKEKKSGKMIKVSDDGDDLPMVWDWRKYMGITMICWAIAFIRAMEALFNIGRRLEEQSSFSIQHLINNVKIGKYGLEDSNTLGEFVEGHGILEEGECSYTLTKQTCEHVNPKRERIDRFVVIDNVDDVELARLVWKHPVVGVLPLWSNLGSHRHGIYQPPRSEYTQPIYHALLIVGFGVDDRRRYYWIVQNSWGTSWGGEGGFGLLHREHIRGTRSLFTQVYYGEKRGYPLKKNK